MDKILNLVKRREQFKMVDQLFNQGLPCPEPLQFTLDDQYCYGLYTYIHGLRADEVLVSAAPELAERIGESAGRALLKIHALTQRDYLSNERAYREAKFQRAWKTFSNRALPGINLETSRQYVEKHLHLIQQRPVTFRHGDFHPGSMIVGDERLEGIIDFNRADWGDPWDDFYKLAYFGAPLSVPFTRSLIHSYFEGNPPDAFWPIYNLYVAATLPADLNWCVGEFAAELPKAEGRVRAILESHDFAHGGPPKWWNSLPQ